MCFYPVMTNPKGRRAGRPPEIERTATTLRIDSALYQRVVELARQESRPLNRQVEVLLKRALGEA